MATPPRDTTPTQPTGPEAPDRTLEQIVPVIRDLQRLLTERFSGGVRRPGGGEIAAISIGSCDHHSCS